MKMKPVPVMNGGMAKSWEQNKNMEASRKSLPIFAGRNQLIRKIRDSGKISGSQSLILIGETGSGKTTQVPQYLYEAKLHGEGLIAVTQPRRVAAVSLANRVAQEMRTHVGDVVGYRVRFENVTRPETKIVYMTDGMLLRDAMKDSFLNKYSVIILDECHERTLHTDILFAVVKQAQKTRHERILRGASGCTPLKVVIMSATMDADKFSIYFSNAEVCYVRGRQFHIQTMFAESQITDYVHYAIVALYQIHKIYATNLGTVLIFLTGQEEIESCVRKAKEFSRSDIMKEYPAMKFFPFYADLNPKAIERVFEKSEHNSRKVIFATNVAETSLTIPGITFVIDSGKVKSRMYDPNSRLDMLKVVNISKAQAEQRRGRAGREGPGYCYRLFSQKHYEAMSEFTVPEVKRCNLTGVVLELLSMNIDVKTFEFIDKPDEAAIDAAIEELKLLGAVQDDPSKSGNLLVTSRGKIMSHFPIDPKLSRIILAGGELGCAEEVCSIIAGLSYGSVFISSSAQEEDRNQAHQKFDQPEGDFKRILRVQQMYRALSKSEIKNWCIENVLHERGLSSIQQIRSQIKDICAKLSIPMRSCGSNFDLVRRALCYGLFMNAGMLDLGGKYKLFEGNLIGKIHPGSCMMGRRPSFLVYNELVFTNQVYCREVCAIQPEWLWAASPEYCEKKRIPGKPT